MDVDAAVIDALAARFVGAQNHADQLLVDLSSSEAFRFVEPQFRTQ
jgi:hypothetical protein